MHVLRPWVSSFSHWCSHNYSVATTSRESEYQPHWVTPRADSDKEFFSEGGTWFIPLCAIHSYCSYVSIHSTSTRCASHIHCTLIYNMLSNRLFLTSQILTSILDSLERHRVASFFLHPFHIPISFLFFSLALYASSSLSTARVVPSGRAREWWCEYTCFAHITHEGHYKWVITWYSTT